MFKSFCEEAVILAGGEGTRLRPFTSYTSKHLLPVGGAPMIHYSFRNCRLLGVRSVVVIINPKHKRQWEDYFSAYETDLRVTLVEQDKALGIPHAIGLAEPHLVSDSFYAILGDNLLVAAGFNNRFKKMSLTADSACAFFEVFDPSQFGVGVFSDGKLIDLVEKPRTPPSNFACIGYYFFKRDVFEKIASLKFSERNELEVVDLLRAYLRDGKLQYVVCDHGNDFWLDTGTNEAIYTADSFVRMLRSIARW